MDLNHDRQNQNLLCYHYTIPLCLVGISINIPTVKGKLYEKNFFVGADRGNAPRFSDL